MKLSRCIHRCGRFNVSLLGVGPSWQQSIWLNYSGSKVWLCGWNPTVTDAVTIHPNDKWATLCRGTVCISVLCTISWAYSQSQIKVIYYRLATYQEDFSLTTNQFLLTIQWLKILFETLPFHNNKGPLSHSSASKKKILTFHWLWDRIDNFPDLMQISPYFLTF